MCKLLFFTVLLVSSARAALISTQTNCLGFPGCSASAGPYFASVAANPPPQTTGGSFSASASFQDDLVFTVTAGPEQGFFAVCFSGQGDTSRGSDFVEGDFAGQGVGNGSRFFQIQTCPPFQLTHVPLTSFTRDVAIRSTMLLSAAVSTSGPSPQGFASVAITGFDFFDESMNVVSDVTYTLAPMFPTPEPAPISLVLCGTLFFAFAQWVRRSHRPITGFRRHSIAAKDVDGLRASAR